MTSSNEMWPGEIPLSNETLAYGERAASALLGLDARYRAESGDETGLVVLNMDLEGHLTADAFAEYGAARAAFEKLREQAESLIEPDRRLYYDQLCHSSLAFIRWRENGLPFQDQLSDFLRVPAAPASQSELDEIESALSALLTERGLSGTLREQCEAWEHEVVVPADEVGPVLQELMRAAWDQTHQTLLPIPAPPSDGMRALTVRGVSYNARCNYLKRQVEINVDPVLTRPGLRHLAVHEGYPGHYVQFKLRETGVAEGWAAADVLLSVVNTASSSVFEGIADTGLAMLGWDADVDDKIQGLLTRHRAGIGTVAAWRLHAEGQDRSDVKAWLGEAALTGGSGWVENRLRFIEAPARAVLIWSYWWGERAVRPAWDAVPTEKRPAFLRYLHGRLHSVDTVGMFGA
jgi:hypothetical protein